MQCDSPVEGRLDGHAFKHFWLNVAHGTLSLGAGPAGCRAFLQHMVPIQEGPLYIGLLSWDSRVAFRNILPSPPLRSVPVPGSLAPRPASLAALVLQALPAALTPATVCTALSTLARFWAGAVPQWADCIDFLARSLPAVLRGDASGFCALPGDVLQHVVSYGDVNASEALLFAAVEAWAFQTPASLQSPAVPTVLPEGCKVPPAEDAHVSAALQHVRFPLMSAAELQRVEASPLMAGSLVLPGLLAEARCPSSPGTSVFVEPAHNAAIAGRCSGDASRSDRASTDSTPRSIGGRHGRLCRQADLWRQRRAQPRCPSNVVELIFTHVDDQNGLVYFLGTRHGLRFVNPHRTGAIEACSSSPFHAYSDAGHFVSQAANSMVCALSNADGEAFWRLRLTQGRALACHHYSVRVNGSRQPPQSWALQACSAGGTWQTLHSVTDDTTFKRPGQCAAWPVEHSGTPQFFRSFRLLLLPPKDACDSLSVLNVAHLELYGFLSAPCESS